MSQRQARIGIVGAGAGGISLARLLKDRGIENVVIFERTDRVGGKSLTWTWQGLAHELGTCYVGGNYGFVKTWFAEHGLGLFRLRKSAGLRPDGSVTDFREFVSGPMRSRSLLEFARYSLTCLGYSFCARTPAGRAFLDNELSKPYDQWLLERRLGMVYRFALRSMTVMGYGALQQVPALNGLRWTRPSLILKAALGEMFEPVEGWAVLWERLAAGMEIRYDAGIQDVVREGARYRVETAHGAEMVDHLVVTTPLDECGWMELPPAVSSVALNVEWHVMITTLVVAEGWFRDWDTLFFEANTLAAAGPGLGHILGARRTGDKVPGLPSDRPDVYVTYQYGAPLVSDEQALETLRRDIAEMGGRVTEVIVQRRWKYCPTLKPEAIASGMVWEMEALQGVENLWFSGATFSHESILNIAEFNAGLADRMAARIRQN